MNNSTKKTFVYIARMSGYSPSHVSRVMRGETKPSVECLQRIALILHISIDDLVKRIEEGKDEAI